MLHYGLFCLSICISVRNVFINISMLCIVKYKKNIKNIIKKLHKKTCII